MCDVIPVYFVHYHGKSSACTCVSHWLTHPCCFAELCCSSPCFAEIVLQCCYKVPSLCCFCILHRTKQWQHHAAPKCDFRLCAGIMESKEAWWESHETPSIFVATEKIIMNIIVCCSCKMFLHWKSTRPKPTWSMWTVKAGRTSVRQQLFTFDRSLPPAERL